MLLGWLIDLARPRLGGGAIDSDALDQTLMEDEPLADDPAGRHNGHTCSLLSFMDEFKQKRPLLGGLFSRQIKQLA
jgi:hypothetical protein